MDILLIPEHHRSGKMRFSLPNMICLSLFQFIMLRNIWIGACSLL